MYIIKIRYYIVQRERDGERKEGAHTHTHTHKSPNDVTVSVIIYLIKGFFNHETTNEV